MFSTVIHLVVAVSVAVMPTVTPCRCPPVKPGAVADCDHCQVDALPSCCQARVAKQPTGAGDRESQSCPPFGCQCSPPPPPATIESVDVEPIVTAVALPSPPKLLGDELLGASHYDSPRIAIGGNQLRAVLCVWRN